jgi:hypothetical protein
VIFAEAVALGRSVFEADGEGKGAGEIRAVADEVLMEYQNGD